jgi:hypothetical protein
MLIKSLVFALRVIVAINGADNFEKPAGFPLFCKVIYHSWYFFLLLIGSVVCRPTMTAIVLRTAAGPMSRYRRFLNVRKSTEILKWQTRRRHLFPVEAST